VDQVVSDADVFARADQALRIGDVSFVELQARRLERVGFGAIADQAADGRLRTRQRRGQPSADEPRGAGDEGV
jgi:hypothetical protein